MEIRAKSRTIRKLGDLRDSVAWTERTDEDRGSKHM